MTEPTNTNPATRLKTLIQQLDQIPKVPNQADTFRKRFAAVWGDSDDEFLVGRILQARRLIRQYQKIIQQIGQDSDLYLTIVPKLSQLFPLMMLDSDWNTHRSGFQQGDYTTLIFAERMLDRVDIEWRIQQEELTNLELMVDEVIFTVTNSSLNDETKELLLTHLEQVKQALKDYEMIGVVALQDALAQGIGQVIVHSEELSVPEARESLSKLQMLWGQIGKVTKWAVKHQETIMGAVDAVVKLLGNGNS